MICNTRTGLGTMSIFCNANTAKTTTITYLVGMKGDKEWIHPQGLSNAPFLVKVAKQYRLRQGPAQEFPFFYTPSYLSELQSCKSIISTDFSFIFIFKSSTTQCSHWIVSCTKKILIFVYGYLSNQLTVL